MEAIFLKLVNMSINASWLIFGILLLRLVLKRMPKSLRCALWALVAVRLLCPFSLESNFSLLPSSEPLPEDIIYTAAPAIDSGVEVIDNVVNPILTESLTPQAVASANPTQIWSFIFASLWLAGIAVMTLYALGSYLYLRLRVRTAVPVTEQVWECDDIDSPFILGFLRPRIYLPSDLVESSREHVIAHENAHLKRFDHWWKAIGFGLLTVYWFNPLIWIAYICLCRDIELACDEKVIRELVFAEKKAYSEALLVCSAPHRFVAACPLAFGEVGVKDRIESVLNYKSPLSGW